MWPPQSVNTWLTPASLSVRATSSPPVILAEGATPSESPRRSLQTRLAARVAEPPRPPLGSHNRDFQTRLAARVAEPPRPPLGSHNHDFQTRRSARTATHQNFSHLTALRSRPLATRTSRTWWIIDSLPET